MDTVHNHDIPLVAVFMATYNHERYIRTAIESILNQKTNFKFKFFIGEDCSKDNTRAICMEYQKSYPEIIEVICTKENNIKVNAANLWTACMASGAKYIAQCEGDDYWIDPLKLQKQFDFMEANPDFSFCFSALEVVQEIDAPIKKFTGKLDKEIFTIEDFILSYVAIAHTATLFFRNIMPNPLPAFYYTAISGDIFTAIMMADKGKAKYFPEPLAAYRNHAGGLTKTKENNAKSNAALIQLYKNLNEYFNFKYDKLFKRRLLENARVQLIYGAKDKKGMQKLKHYFKNIPDYFRYSEKINFKELAYYHSILFFPFLLKAFKPALSPKE